MQLLAGLGPLGLPELAIIAFIVVLVFGVGRLPEVGGAVGKGIREFRKATKDGEETPDATMQSVAVPESAAPAAVAEQAPMSAAPAPTPAASSSDTMFCSECGGKNTRGAKFCAHCGHGIAATIS
jgi:sec-independent protein translocase protein TatA